MKATTAHTLFRPLHAAFVLAALALSSHADAGVAGRIQFVAGDVRVLDAAGKERAAAKGQDVNEGETVTTGANASAQLRMIDGGLVALRPDTRLKVETYVYNGKEDGSENAVFALLKGGLRAITGIIGKRNKERYSLRTPTATIGIRGTDHEPFVVLPPEPGQTSAIPAGTYDKVNVGATAITTKAGTALIAPNQVGFAAAPDQPPVILPKMPDFYRSAAAPQAKQEKQEKKEEKKDEQKAEQKEQKQQAKEAVREAIAAAAGNDEVKSVVKAVLQEKITLAQLRLTGVDDSGNAIDLSGGGEKLRGVGITDGWQDHQGSNLFDPNKFNIKGLFQGSIDGDLQPPDKVIAGAKGLIEFQGEARGYKTVEGTRLDPRGTPGTERPTVTIRIGTAVNADVGSYTVDGHTVAWGRWEGGVIDIYSLDGSTKLGTIDNANRSAHWLATSPIDRSVLALPTSGTASYAVVGSTTPTDFKGNTGTLGTVKLDADFGLAKINAALEVSFNSPNNTSHWVMRANNVPLSSDKDGFQSYSALNGVNGISHVVSCTGPSCGEESLGYMDAHLFSQGHGAVMTYGMMTGTVAPATDTLNRVVTPTNGVTGLVVMKKQ